MWGVGFSYGDGFGWMWGVNEVDMDRRWGYEVWRESLMKIYSNLNRGNETLVIDEDCDESSDAVSEIYEYDLDFGLEDIDESGFFMPDGSDIRFENGVLEEDPYDFVYDGLPSQCHVLKDPRFCVKCGAKKIEFEYPTLCCMGGKTKLVDPDIPPDLYNIFISQCDVGKRFRRSIRAYNTNFSFASMGVQLDEDMNEDERNLAHPFAS
ncbi:hypothetical protein Tco_1187246 [Tanacetum coccineum]